MSPNRKIEKISRVLPNLKIEKDPRVFPNLKIEKGPRVSPNLKIEKGPCVSWFLEKIFPILPPNLQLQPNQFSEDKLTPKLYGNK